MVPNLLIAGDPHGNFSEIHQAWQDYPHTPTLFAGDQGCLTPFPEIIQHRTDTYFIDGNHDGDKKIYWDNLHADPTRDINGRVITIGNMRVAGLGGVFRGKVWAPTSDQLSDVPTFTDAEWASEHGHKSIRNIPIKHRVSIWPETIRALAQQQADILLCHEAPTPHEHGWGIILTLAKDMGVHTIIHGHHHIDYQRTYNGINIHGVGIGGVQDLYGRIIIPGRYSPERAVPRA